MNPEYAIAFMIETNLDIYILIGSALAFLITTMLFFVVLIRAGSGE